MYGKVSFSNSLIYKCTFLKKSDILHTIEYNFSENLILLSISFALLVILNFFRYFILRRSLIEDKFRRRQFTESFRCEI